MSGFRKTQSENALSDVEQTTSDISGNLTAKGFEKIKIIWTKKLGIVQPQTYHQPQQPF